LRQKSAVLYSIPTVEKGFVIAPFDTNNGVYIIKEEEKNAYKAPDRQPLPKELISPPETGKTSFLKMLQQADELLQKGKLKKVVLSRQVTVSNTKASPIALYLKMLAYFPNAFVYFWHHPKLGTWLGASPEQLLQQQQTSYTTMALAGTLPFSEAPQWTSKEQEEQQMVVDAILGALAAQLPTSEIQVSPTHTKQAGNLVHLNTDIQFKASDTALLELTKALHPTPAVGGVPRPLALQTIKDLEGYDRAFYSGFLGPISKDAAQLFVNLRCMSWSPETAQLYVGGGITAQSTPTNEWMETQRKAQILYNLCIGKL
jgi:isochorismate synthase